MGELLMLETNDSHVCGLLNRLGAPAIESGD